MHDRRHVESRTRVQAVDALRGIVMMLMALDHVRVYSGVPAGGPDPAVFLTRWVTHFCAPTFFFAAGVSMFLSMQARGRRAVARMLWIRGLWLVLLELTFLRVAWGFDLRLDLYWSAGVIWSLGWCMVGMAALVFAPRAVLALLCAAVLLGHNAVGELYITGSPWVEEYHWLGRILYAGGLVELWPEGPVLVVLYSLVPWIAVMAAGFLFGPVLSMPRDRRDRFCRRAGGAMLATFLVLRATDWYGDPRPWSEIDAEWPRWTAFLHLTKYPASLSYLLLMLGPALCAIPWLDRIRGGLARVVVQFGRVPFFFYLLHIPLIHAVAVLIAWFREPAAISWLCKDQPYPLEDPPDGYTYGLPLLYGVTLVVLVVLYAACRWYSGVRPRLPRFWRSLL